MKTSKAASIFWASIYILFEAIIVIGVTVMYLLGELHGILLIFAILPAVVIAFVIYFLIQRLREIDFEEKHKDEYKNY